MFIVVVAFMLMQFFFMYKAVETVPFYLFTMFAPKSDLKDTTYRTTVFINGKKLNTEILPNRENEVLFGSFEYYQSLRTRNFIATDTTTIRKRFRNKLKGEWYDLVYNRLTNKNVTDSLFLNWWGRYLSRVIKEKICSLSIVRSSVITWKPSFKVREDTVTYFNHIF